MYSIIFSALALKQLKKLDKKLSDRIIAVIDRCKIRPYAHARRLVNSRYFRLRVGTYRVIMRIQDNDMYIIVIEIDHRKKIYKRY